MSIFPRISYLSASTLLLLTSIASAGKLTLNVSGFEDNMTHGGQRVKQVEFVVRTAQEGSFFPTNKKTADYDLEDKDYPYWMAYLHIRTEVEESKETKKEDNTVWPYVYVLKSDGKKLEFFDINKDTHLIINASYDKDKKAFSCVLK